MKFQITSTKSQISTNTQYPIIKTGSVFNLSFVFLNLFVFCFLVFGISLAPSAQALGLTPAVIDEKALPRDIINASVTLKNDAAKRLSFYADVKNVDLQAGAQAFTAGKTGAELADSLANWIEFTRGVIDIEPGEELAIPLRISVDLRAIPGVYHAQITFHQGWNQANALSNPADGRVDINIEILDDAKLELQVASFAAAKSFFFGFPAKFRYAIENIGNRPIRPWGEIRLYDRRGREVGALPLAEEHEQIEPSGTVELASIWDGVAKSGWLGGAGRYKAVLDVRYGSKGQSLQDTAWVWVLPWWMALAAVALFGASGAWVTRKIRHAAAPSQAYSGVAAGGVADLAAFPESLAEEAASAYRESDVSDTREAESIETRASQEAAEASEISPYAYVVEPPSARRLHGATQPNVAVRSHTVPIVAADQPHHARQAGLSWNEREDDWHFARMHQAPMQAPHHDAQALKPQSTHDLRKGRPRAHALPSRHRKNPFHRSRHVVNLRKD